MSGTAGFGAVEVVYDDGDSAYFEREGSSLTYTPYVGDADPLNTVTVPLDTLDGSLLTRNPTGPYSATNPAWTLIDADGLAAGFDSANPSSGSAPLLSLQTQPAASGGASLTYGYSTDAAAPGRLTSISDSFGRTMSLAWNDLNPGICPAALLCVTGPDDVTWRYIGLGPGGTSGPLERVNDGTRDVLKLRWFDLGGKQLVDTIWNANDLDPVNATPGYNGSHALTIAYDQSPTSRFYQAVTRVTEGPITSGGTSTSPYWTFTYVTSYVYPLAATLADHEGTPAGTIRTASYAGYTQIRSPNQQPSGPTDWVFWDRFGHPLELRDPLHFPRGATLLQYTADGRLLWSEDYDGNPTDQSWDPATKALLATKAPDPDGAGPLGRPTTSYRYDERAIDPATGIGTPLEGLHASYYANQHLAGQPTKVQNDQTVDYNWGTSGPVALAGQREGFSVRWRGTLSNLGAGTYTFKVTSDDGSRLFVDGQLLIDDWSTHPVQSRSAAISFPSATTHSIALEYFQATGPAEVHLAWMTPDQAESLIPAPALRPAAFLNQTSVISPSGRVSFSHFADPASHMPDYTLDGGPLRLVTNYQYDALGRVTKKVTPKGNIERAIDGQGNLTGSSDVDYATTWTYYATNETATPPAACGALPTVDQAGLLKTVRQEGSLTESGSLKPGGVNPITSVYDLAGRPIAVSYGRGTSCSSYDTAGRLVSERVPAEAVIAGCTDLQATACYTYDPAGALRTARNALGTVTFDYDEGGRIIRSLDSFGAEAKVGYDLNSNVTSEIAATGSLSSSTTYARNYAYDGIDQLTLVREPPNTNTYFSYDKRGNLKAIHQLNGTFAWFDYDAAGWLTHAYNRHGTLSLALPASAPADPNPLADYEYGYDIDGRETSETRIAAGEQTAITGYTYDTLGRLETVALPNSTLRTYLFDPDSNRTEITERPSGGTAATVAAYMYDPTASPGLDQLTSVNTAATTTFYGYTADGDVSFRGAQTFRWDGRGRLSGATVGDTDISYQYDAVGRLQARISATTGSTTTIRYVYVADGDTPYFETSGSGSIVRTSLEGPAGSFAAFDGPPTAGAQPPIPKSYLYYSGHGDLAATASANGARTASYTYDPFGAPKQSGISDALTDRWLGQSHRKLDTTTDLIQMGARPYDPSLGRFFAVDPVEGGALNNYDYAGQDPVNSFDLDGRVVYRAVGGGAPMPASTRTAGTGAGGGGCCTRYGQAPSHGRAGGQARLKQIENDPKASRADRGWIRQDRNEIARGQRKTIRRPPGKELAHRRGKEACKGYCYRESDLQVKATHKTQTTYAARRRVQ